MIDDTTRFAPVVAVDMDGVLRVAEPDPGEPAAEGVFRKRITIHRDGYPDYLHREPDWNERDEWVSYHWLSGVGAEWVRSLLDRGIQVVWATTWRWTANKCFAKALGLPELPVATAARGPDFWSGSLWKAAEMGDRFPGQPLLWVDDQVGPEALRVLEWERRPLHPSLTCWHCVQAGAGISGDDITQMEDWLALASSADGQRNLRRRCDQRDEARQQGPNARFEVSRTDRWQAINRRLILAIGPDQVLTELLADLAVTHPNNVAPAQVDKLVAKWGPPHTPRTATLLDLMCTIQPDELAAHPEPV